VRPSVAYLGKRLAGFSSLIQCREGGGSRILVKDKNKTPGDRLETYEGAKIKRAKKKPQWKGFQRGGGVEVSKKKTSGKYEDIVGEDILSHGKTA